MSGQERVNEQVDVTLRMSPIAAMQLEELVNNPNFRLLSLVFAPTTSRLSKSQWKAAHIRVPVAGVDGVQR